MKHPATILHVVKAKVRDQAGDSLAETLVAMLIAALGTVALVTMIATSNNVIHASSNAVEETYTAEAAIAIGETTSFGEATISGADLQTIRVDVEVYESDSLYRYEEKTAP